MEVSPIKQNSFRIITPKTTGYAATTCMALAIYSGVTKSKTLKKQHKFLGYLSVLLTAVHIGLIEYYHHKYKSDALSNKN